jgi:Transposase DDE domain
MLAESCRQDEVARQVNCGERVGRSARRWRRFLDNSAFPIQSFFVEWSQWVTAAVGLKHLTLVVDETKLQDRLGIMVVGLAWENRCLPLAWQTYPANSKMGYPPEGQVGLIRGLLQTVKAGLPAGVEVLVLADRGIGTSPDLCRAVAALGWHYLFRVTCQTKIVTTAGALTIAQQVQPGEIWAAQGLVFKQRGRIPAQARALWAAGYAEPWALVTHAERLSGAEYARRNWQEQSFRDLKSGGWHWQASRVRQAEHLARLLVLWVIAYTWTVALGSQAVAQGRAQPLPKRADGQPRRWWSLFKEGLRFFVEHIQRNTICSDLVFIPDRRFT